MAGKWFFDDRRSDLTIPKANFPENLLCHVNQRTVSLVKTGEKAIYLEFVVTGQLLPVANSDPAINLDTHVFKDNEVLLCTPVFNKATGLYGGLTKKLGLITLGGDDRERFFSYGYSKEKSSVFYCYMKQPLPNIFHCTAFKKHHPFLLDENQKKVKFSKMFLYLTSTLDRKDDFLQYKDLVHLHPVDISYDDLTQMHNNKDINTAFLDDKNLRGQITGTYYKVMKKVSEISNQNVVRNSDAYISNGGKMDPHNELS